MKFIDIAEKSVEELNSLLKEKKIELFGTKMKLKTMQLKNSSELKNIRKDIARIQTALSQKSAQKKAEGK
jgi:large subunit ribosomal protein L29